MVLVHRTWPTSSIVITQEPKLPHFQSYLWKKGNFGIFRCAIKTCASIRIVNKSSMPRVSIHKSSFDRNFKYLLCKTVRYNSSFGKYSKIFGKYSKIFGKFFGEYGVSKDDTIAGSYYRNILMTKRYARGSPKKVTSKSSL